jgi:hypothetical protein
VPCGTLIGMRRVETAIVIVALLAIPIALPARTGPCAQSQCSRMCGLILRSLHTTERKHQHCICGMSGDGQHCATQPSQKLPDYGLNAPIAPTLPSARTNIAAPNSARGIIARDTRFAVPEFVSEFFEPPRV